MDVRTGESHPNCLQGQNENDKTSPGAARNGCGLTVYRALWLRFFYVNLFRRRCFLMADFFDNRDVRLTKGVSDQRASSLTATLGFPFVYPG